MIVVSIEKLFLNGDWFLDVTLSGKHHQNSTKSLNPHLIENQPQMQDKIY